MCVLLSAFVSALGSQRSAPADTAGWNPAAAAHYLDGRAEWWTTWPNATRDSGTYCMSCHTTLPYALARPALRSLVGESAPSPAEEKILANLLRRARSWHDVEPWYPDQTRGLPKTSESRAIEAVMNALVLVRRDAAGGRLTDDSRTALDVMWKLQMKTGPEGGAWTGSTSRWSHGNRRTRHTSERRWLHWPSDPRRHTTPTLRRFRSASRRSAATSQGTGSFVRPRQVHERCGDGIRRVGVDIRKVADAPTPSTCFGPAVEAVWRGRAVHLRMCRPLVQKPVVQTARTELAPRSC